jgi:phosphoribosylanthranilate isomerase
MIKICGIVSLDEAETASRRGATALGFVIGGTNLTKPVSVHTAKEIIATLNRQIETVLVTHFEDPESIVDVAREIGCTMIQIVEDIPVDQIEYVRQKTGKKIIKTVDTSKYFEDSQYYTQCEKIADFFLIDTRFDGKLGGTGVVSNPDTSRKIIEEFKIPTLLAGGLNSENVSELVEKIKPYGIDILSGVQDGNTRDEYVLSEKKLAAFISNGRKALQGIYARVTE